MASRYGGYEEYEFIAGFYDPIYEHRVTKDIDLFIDYSRKANGRTLELGCGTGRVLIPIAVSGCEITGLDHSPYMLRICQDKLYKQPKEVQDRVKLIKGDMTSFDTGETYSLVTVPLRTFQHLTTVEEQQACLGCINKHLIPNGLLVIDIFNPSLSKLYEKKYMDEQEDFPETKLSDGRTLRRTIRIAAFHRDQQCNNQEFIYYVSYPDGRTERLVQTFPFRYFFRYEFEHLLAICGFRVVDLFGNFDRSVYSGDSPEMIFVAEKK
jgi:SAM-dependent methyltransferase